MPAIVIDHEALCGGYFVGSKGRGSLQSHPVLTLDNEGCSDAALRRDTCRL